jgi:nondiscriminating glutamyl-tRNA synthetase
LGWAPSGGTREIFAPQELIQEFSLERVTPSAAVFDMEKLYWLNRQYIKQAAPERINRLALAYYSRAIAEDLLKDSSLEGIEGVPLWTPPQPILDWLAKITQLLAPYVDRLDQLPDRASMIFNYDAAAALASPDNAEVLAWPQTKAVFSRFVVKVLADETRPMTPEEFKKIINEVKAETGTKGKELFHPIRIVITGSHSGPDFDRLIPILEEGSKLSLPKHVLSVRERVEQFCHALKC